MPYNERAEPENVFVGNLPGFKSIKFHKVNRTFIDHSLESQVVKAQRFTLSEMELALREAQCAGLTIYIHECLRTWDDIQEDKYTLQWLAVKTYPAPLFQHFDIAPGIIMNPTTLKPALKTDFHLDIENFKSLAACWGIEELAKQLGEFIIEAIAARDYDGKPELPNERIDSIDPHPTPA